jgi:tRNA(Ile)-lysidine synthase
MSAPPHMKSRLPALACLPEGKALLGISGGRDSVALLHLLLAAGHRHLVLCHLNHRLRGRESDADAEFVRALALRHDLPCEIARSDVKALAKRRKLSLETAAREARHAFFQRMSRKHGTRDVLLAHHAEDQAETILGNICRGCGLDGLSGMPLSGTLGSLRLLRPLLPLRRADIDAYVSQHGIAYRDDASNDSPRHRRNRLRHEALPLLSDIAGRDVVPLLNRLGLIASEEDQCLDQQARALLLHHIRADGLHELEELRRLDPALRHRLFGIWLRDFCRLPDLGFDDIRRAAALLFPDGPAKTNLPQGKHLRRKANRLWVE